MDVESIMAAPDGRFFCGGSEGNNCVYLFALGNQRKDK